VQLRLASEAIRVAPGSAESIAFTVRNMGTKVEDFRCLVAGPPWIAAEPAAMSVYPGQEASGTVQAAPPLAPESRAGVTPFRLTVTSAVNANISGSATGSVDVAPYFELATELRPSSSSGRGRTRHNVRLDNRGNTPLRVMLRPTDVADGLRVGVPPSADVLPGTVSEVPVEVRGRWQWFGRPQPKNFAIIAEAPRPLAPARLPGTRTLHAAFPRWVPVAAGLVVMAGVVSAVAIPMLKHPANPSPSSSGPPVVQPSSNSGPPGNNFSASASASASTSVSASTNTSPNAPPPPPAFTAVDLVQAAPNADWTWTSAGNSSPLSVNQGATGCQPQTSGAGASVDTVSNVQLADGNTAATAIETDPDPGTPGFFIKGVFNLTTPTPDANEVLTGTVELCQAAPAGSQMTYGYSIGSGPVTQGTISLFEKGPIDVSLPTGTSQVTLWVTDGTSSAGTNADVIWTNMVIQGPTS
jgi:hypothetical protein